LRFQPRADTTFPMPRLKAPQRRQQIVSVATQLFAERGYEATTTAAIAEAAGVTEPILYRHFESKQELFVAIVREMSELTLRHWNELIAGTDDAADAIRRIARHFPAHVAKLADAYHVIHGALSTSRDKQVLKVMHEHYEQIEEFFVALIRRGQKAGLVRKDLDPRIPAWQLIYLGIGIAMISLNLPGLYQGQPLAEGIEMLVKGLKA
jgi:AcrR family transcriptional regulator